MYCNIIDVFLNLKGRPGINIPTESQLWTRRALTVIDAKLTSINPPPPPLSLSLSLSLFLSPSLCIYVCVCRCVCVEILKYTQTDR